MTSSNETSSTIKSLVKTNRDAEQGYRLAAERITNEVYGRLFAQLAQQRSGFADQLQAEAQRVGETVHIDEHLSAKLHRSWIRAKEFMSDSDLQAVVSECVRGDSAAVDIYRDALDQDLPDYLLNILQGQHESIEQTLQQMEALEQKLTS